MEVKKLKTCRLGSNILTLDKDESTDSVTPCVIKNVNEFNPNDTENGKLYFVIENETN